MVSVFKTLSTSFQATEVCVGGTVDAKFTYHTLDVENFHGVSICICFPTRIVITPNDFNIFTIVNKESQKVPTVLFNRHPE